MKRSEINKQIKWAMQACKRLGFHLPSFAFWSNETWEANKDRTEHMVSVCQGWDVTDYNKSAPCCLPFETATFMIQARALLTAKK